MTEIEQLSKEKVILTDGAMGTYYHDCGGKCDRAEIANIEQPQLVEKIHREYIEAGAQLIRTNTFGANTRVLGCDMDYVKKVIEAAYTIACDAARESDTAIAADIGPIPQAEDMTEYYAIADIWLSLGAKCFVVETFTQPYAPLALAAYIKEKCPEAWVHVSYALTDTGYTKNSFWCGNLVEGANDCKDIDSVGFNCGVGPMHMANILKRFTNLKKPLWVLPNAGYPEMINGRVVYALNPDYYAETLAGCVRQGIKAVGGCCGTTPKHIALLKKMLQSAELIKQAVEERAVGGKTQQKESQFFAKLKKNEFVLAVELDPPFKPNSEKLVNGAKILKENGVDIITIADSPMGKSRVDSVIMSLKLMREAGVQVLPHICCRDKNAVSLRSVLLGAYMEGVRNVLVVTGDPVPGEFRSDIKSVFNMNSYTLIDMISQMNENVFEEGKISVGGAVNFNVKQKEKELERLLKKHKNGAEFFLTQPIFDDATIDFIKTLPKDRTYKILAGIMPPVSYKNVQFLNNELAGVTIPQKMVEKFSPEMSREEAQQTGEAIALEIIEKVKPYVDGLYIIAPFNRCEMICDICTRVMK